MDKQEKGNLLGGQNTIKNCNWGASMRDWGGFCPPSLYVKRGPVSRFLFVEIIKLDQSSSCLVIEAIQTDYAIYAYCKEL